MEPVGPQLLGRLARKPSGIVVPESDAGAGGGLATTFMEDSMSGAAGTALSAHVGELGATWTAHPAVGGGVAVLSDANRLRSNHASDAFYYASAVPTGPEYDVIATMVYKSGVGQMMIAGRVDIAVQTYYYVLMPAAGATAFRLRKWVAGAMTEFGSYDASAFLVVDQPFEVKLEIRNATKKMFVGPVGASVERVSTTDNTIAAKGRVAAGSTNAIMANNTGLHIDSLVAKE